MSKYVYVKFLLQYLVCCKYIINIIVVAAVAAVIAQAADRLLGLSLGSFQQPSYWSPCPQSFLPPVHSTVQPECLSHITHFTQQFFNGSPLYFHTLIFFNHSGMKHWSQHDLQDTIIGKLKIKTGKSQVIFLNFKKLLILLFESLFVWYCCLMHHPKS